MNSYNWIETCLTPFNELINDVKLSEYGDNIHLTDFLRKNYDLIANMCSASVSTQLAVLHPNGLRLEQWYLLFSAVIMLKLNIQENSMDIVSHLNAGDIVIINGRRGQYKGIIGNKIYVKFNDIEYYFPKEQMTKLQKYEGSAKRLNNFNGIIEKDPLRDVITKLYKKEYVDIAGVSKNGIIIFTEKDKITSFLESIEINSIPFTSVFPTGYFINSYDFVRLKGDLYQRFPMIRITSNLSVLVDILQSDYQTNLVIIDGKKSWNGYFGEIEYIQDYCKIKGIHVLFVDNIDTENADYLMRKEVPHFKWDREKITENCLDVSHLRPSLKYINHSIKERLLLHNFIHRKMNLIKLEIFPQIVELEENICTTLQYLKSVETSNEALNSFCAVSYSMLRYLKNLLYPSCFDQGSFQLRKSYFQQVEFLRESSIEIIGRVLPEEDSEKLNGITENLETLLNLYDSDNLKASIILDTVKSTISKICIIVRKPYQVINLKQYLSQYVNVNNIHVCTIKELTRCNDFFDEIFISGWFSSNLRYVLNSGISTNVSILLYEDEYEYFCKYNLRDLKSHNFEVTESETDQEANPTKNNTSMNYLIDTDFFHNKLSQIMSTLEKNDDERFFTAKPVFFEEDCFALITPRYNINLLSRSMNKIVYCKLKDIKPGDELIFLNYNDQELFGLLTSKFKELDPEAGRKYELKLKLSKLWRNALIRYSRSYNLNSKIISKRLLKYGCSRVWQTIEAWIDNRDIIGPNETAIIAIAKLTGDEKLNKYLKNCIRSVKDIKRFNRRIRSIMIDSVAKSYITQSPDEFDPLVRTIINDLPKYGRVVTVNMVSENEIRASVNLANKLLEEDV